MAQNEHNDKGWSLCLLCRQPLNSKSRLNDFMSLISSLLIAIRPGLERLLNVLSIHACVGLILTVLAFVVRTWGVACSDNGIPWIFRGSVTFTPSLLGTAPVLGTSGALAFELNRMTRGSPETMPGFLIISIKKLCSLAIFRTG
jgi:hypothetical protein